MHCYTQAGRYDPHASKEIEVAQAKELGLPWDLRGPPKGSQVQYFHGQKRRPDGRYANPGGWKDKVKEIWAASGWHWYYDLKNKKGTYILHALQFVERAL